MRTRIKLTGKMVSVPMTEMVNDMEERVEEERRERTPDPTGETTRMDLTGMTETEVEEFCGAAYDMGWYADVDFEALYGAGWALTGVRVTGQRYFKVAVELLSAIRTP